MHFKERGGKIGEYVFFYSTENKAAYILDFWEAK